MKRVIMANAAEPIGLATQPLFPYTPRLSRTPVPERSFKGLGKSSLAAASGAIVGIAVFRRP